MGKYDILSFEKDFKESQYLRWHVFANRGYKLNLDCPKKILTKITATNFI